MKRLIIILFVVLSFFGTACGEIVFSEDFTTNLAAWTLLDTPSAGATVTVSLSGGKLDVSMTYNERFRVQGVQSLEQYTLPAFGMLVFDFYGVNEGSAHSYPWFAISAFPHEGGCFNSWVSGWFAVKGWDAYFGDWVQWNGVTGEIPGGYADLAGDNAATPKHVIIRIDAANINVYIEDDYYENLSNPTPLYTTATSNVFSSAQLANGLYVVAGAARYTDWYSGTVGETLDEITVSHIVPEPADCNEAIQRGYGIQGDLNADCKVDIYDLIEMLELWLDCLDPENTLCTEL